MVVGGGGEEEREEEERESRARRQRKEGAPMFSFFLSFWGFWRVYIRIVCEIKF